MISSSKRGLGYYTNYYSPYQFQQYRILEFPRYRQFAQSFPNTVPYSEDMGFIGRLKKPDDIDFTYFVTAHELAHQWWGHQLIGALVQGSNMMSESLAEYSALRVMQHQYGDPQMRRFLKYELDGYLRGRAGEVRHEPPLVLVQNEPYVWYQKGSLVLYALSDYIGEDKLNAALGNYLRANRYSQPPYPDTRGFVEALRSATPPDLQYLITDMFESITLYDNRAVSATWQETPDHKYKVVLNVKSRKLKANGDGVETEVPIHDLIEVGVFSGKKDHEQPIHVEKQWITKNDSDHRIHRRSETDARRHRSLQQAHRPQPRRQHDRCEQDVIDGVINQRPSSHPRSWKELRPRPEELVQLRIRSQSVEARKTSFRSNQFRRTNEPCPRRARHR